jgi:hypothetical protein
MRIKVNFFKKKLVSGGYTRRGGVALEWKRVADFRVS